jgi:hypothetical protein
MEEEEELAMEDRRFVTSQWSRKRVHATLFWEISSTSLALALSKAADTSMFIDLHHR